ncbi:MAG TPA: hypothetical protein VHB98_21630 [Chloroflexota bacterium]|nr:hypothetical protein [Chloroflexota bacterium]
MARLHSSAVRLVQFRVGQVLHQYVTNVCDPCQLPPREVARLPARRPRDHPGAAPRTCLE